MKTRTLPIIALTALALAGCSTGNNSSEPSSSGEPESSASPTSTGTPAPSENDTAEDTPTADPSGDDMTADDREALAKKNVEAAQGNSVTLTAHSDTPATVNWSDSTHKYGKQFTGDWSETVDSPGDSIWSVDVMPDDEEAEASCQVSVDGKTVDSDTSDYMAMCLQQPETFVQDR